MFVELRTFINEKELYEKKIAELKNTVVNPDELARLLEEERLKFKSITRKYLPTALSVIKNTFKCDYSLYKIGRDVDANFKTIETNVNKTQTEIANEMNQFVEQANGMSLSEEQVKKINLTIDIIMTYVDDNVVAEDENKAFYLNHSKVVASSLDLPVTAKSQEGGASIMPQHNPYANQPLNVAGEATANLNNDNNSMLIDPFAGLYGDNNSFSGANSANQEKALTSQAVSNDSNEFTKSSVITPPKSYEVPQVSMNYSTEQKTVPVPDSYVIPINDSADVLVNRGEPLYFMSQLVATLMIPIMVTVCSLIIYFLLNADFINDVLANAPEGLIKISVYLVLGTVCFIATNPVIKIGKAKTLYIVRFLVVPSLLSLPLSYFYLKFIFETFGNGEQVLDVLAIMLIGMVLYFVYITVLFFKAIYFNPNNHSIDHPKWNAFEKVSMLLIIYLILIPGLYVILMPLEVGFFDDILSTIYFENNKNISQYLDELILIVAPLVATVGAILRTLTQKKQKG